MIVSKVIYTGDLRTEATHLKSGIKLITDAPLDNQGKGEAFSPTDLMSTSLATCMLTIMGIAARTHHIFMDGTTVEVKKIMAENPRRISEIHTLLQIPDNSLTDKQKAILENAATTCPVMLSLHPDIKKVITFNYLK
ncbi:MAG: OsmC family protein [Chitinophagales bacterium]|nr:OsmC family protein [Bacteroidota bacterium]MBK8487575.1 OsmC family protein [Bacteroidota bacterium]MBK8682679.1 OsmC family protein [Bacteroidota bacterium]